MKRFVIERNIPKVGRLQLAEYYAAARKSNEVLRELGPDIQWVESFVTPDKLYCVYLAKDEAIVHKHAQLSGFPASVVSEVSRVLDPTSERGTQ
jgi:Protein of unknown function (DUF4242)